jgi:hypothetical protein
LRQQVGIDDGFPMVKKLAIELLYKKVSYDSFIIAEL